MIDIIDGESTPIAEIVGRKEDEQPDVSLVVGSILSDIKSRGDVALREYTERFDRAKISDFLVSKSEIETARNAVGCEFIEILEAAAANIRAFHEKQKREGFSFDGGEGVLLGQRILPLSRVGVYVPGGTAPYPSTVLMDVIPAKIAGVDEIIMVTPPQPDGSVNSGILAAASVAGADRIYKVGGAQAIAALAYGIESIPKVDKIVGPGNIYVATAKKLVYGVVDIDMIAGPSDILIIADRTANPVFLAADMLGQSEHDEKAAAVLVATDRAVAEGVQRELERQLEPLSRKSIARASLEQNGRIILASDLSKAAEIANALAPEHLELCVDDPFQLLKSIRNAGSVFLGHYTPEALGDYFAGPNHTLPTMGTARFYSPLSVDDFIKKSSFLSYSKEAMQKVGGMVETFAKKEGLTAHANSITVRMGEN